jgi:carbonic anhydrase
MKYVSLIACLLISLNSFAALPDDDADAELTAAAAADPDATATPAPAARSKSSQAKPTAKATNGRPTRDEGTIPTSPATSPSAPADDDETTTAKIDTSKPKSEILKPTVTSTPTRVEKPGKVAPTIEALSKATESASSAASAEQAQKWLENGNTRYVTKKFRADGRTEKDRANKTIKPHAIVLACSDSRVPPEIIFDQGLGEITTVRAAGEVLDLSVIASIEQSILNDHPHLLIVLGHTQCASIEQALAWKETASFGSDALDRMVSEIKPHLKTASAAKSPGLQIEAALQADGVARELPEHSAIIKKAVDSGELKIKTGLYWVETGKVKFY